MNHCVRRIAAFAISIMLLAGCSSMPIEKVSAKVIEVDSIEQIESAETDTLYKIGGGTIFTPRHQDR